MGSSLIAFHYCTTQANMEHMPPLDANSQLGPSHLIELGAFMEQAHAQRVQQQLLGMLGVPARIVRTTDSA